MNKNIKNEDNTTILKTIGFLPVNKNTIDEITLNQNFKIKLESKFQIQVLDNDNNKLKVKYDFEDPENNIHLEKEIEKNQYIEITPKFKFKIDTF